MFFIAGVTGKTGAIVADTLIAEGKRVRVLVRDAAKAETWQHKGADVLVGSLDDDAQLVRALTDVSGAHLLTPPRFGSSDLRAEMQALTNTYARAIHTARVPHVVLLSSMGAHLDEATGTIRVARDAERTLGQTKSKLTFLRAPFFMENWGRALHTLGDGKLPTFFTADRAMPQVATQDIGRVAARLLVEGPGAGTREVVELSGPREYSPRDVANALSGIAKREVVIEEAPTAMIVSVMTRAGLSEHVAALFREMTEAVNAGRIVWERGTARAIRGEVTLEGFLEGLLASARV